MDRHPREPEYMRHPPLPLFEFRTFPPTHAYFMPERGRNRICTNIVFRLVFATFLILAVAFSVAICWQNDTARLLNGRDTCGNVCGVMNTRAAKKLNCTPQDYSNYPLVTLGHASDECVSKEQCDNLNWTVIFRRCLPEDMTKNIPYLRKQWPLSYVKSYSMVSRHILLRL